MLKTSEGEMLELAPWRMRRFVRLLADARRYPAGTPPHVLIQDLRQLLERAHRVSTQPGTATTRLYSSSACCNACLLARERPPDGVLTLLGLSIESPQAVARESGAPPKQEPARIDLKWQYWPTLAAAAVNANGAGVYIVGRGNRPVSAGKSASLPQRLAYLGQALQHRNSGLAVWTANVRTRDLDAVERALVQGLRQYVASPQPQRPVTVGADGLTIAHLLPAGLAPRVAPHSRPLPQPAGAFEWSS